GGRDRWARAHQGIRRAGPQLSDVDARGARVEGPGRHCLPRLRDFRLAQARQAPDGRRSRRTDHFRLRHEDRRTVSSPGGQRPGRHVARVPCAGGKARARAAWRSVGHPLGCDARAHGARSARPRGRHGAARWSRPDARGAGRAAGDLGAARQSRMSRTVRILHLHSSFDAGGKELRCVQLINAFGREFEHAIVSGDPERRSAAAGLDPRIRVVWPNFPPLSGKPWPSRLKKLAAAMAGYDLVCTYNWGAMDAVLAHTMFADVFKLAPLVHHEDGFNEDEADGLKPSRNFYRRIALGRCSALVVPSRTLERIALETWYQPRSKVRLIPNGIDTARMARKQKRDALPRVIKQKGELWVGTLAGLRKVKNLPALVRAFRALPEPWQLVIVG